MFSYQPPALALPLAPISAAGVWWRPSQLFVEELSGWLQGKRVLEVFAGNGYLAAWLARAGVHITATTHFTGHDGHQQGLYHPVEALGARSAVAKYGEDHDVLLVCWPTTTLEVLRAARLWGSRPVVFIGEVTDHAKGHLGGCATDEFFDAIERMHTFETYAGNMLEAAFVCRVRA